MSVQQHQPDQSPAPTLDVGGHSIVVADPAMRALYARVRRLAQHPLPVLVCGETGAGKELIASALHHWSDRRAGPFVELNCAALPETLIESELFGHEKGAFSGAGASRIGLLESGHGGTVFLDELGELSLSAQAKLLRVLETGRFYRLGATRETSVDIRLVAATNRSLLDACQSGRFREDLYYRLSAATLVVPPLRARPDDLPWLFHAFLERAYARTGRARPAVSPAVMSLLLGHDWPGNVRQLRNCADYLAATVRDGEILPEHLPHLADVPASSVRRPPVVDPPESQGATPRPGPPPPSGTRFRRLEDEVQELEQARMREALEAAGWVPARAAALLGMPPSTFALKMKRYGLSPRRAAATG